MMEIKLLHFKKFFYRVFHKSVDPLKAFFGNFSKKLNYLFLNLLLVNGFFFKNYQKFLVFYNFFTKSASYMTLFILLKKDISRIFS